MTARYHRVGTAFALLLMVLAAPPLRADERLKDIACRSVHLSYPAAEGTTFYNEIAVDRSAPGTYFMVCGWDKGYFGMQELGSGKKVLLFSVWDSGQNDPKAVAADKRVQLLHKDAKVRIGRFGGEGTGGQAFFDYDWKAEQTYRLLVAARAEGERTAYSGWFYVPEEKAWKHLVTFSTITGGKVLRGYYSFIEDFKRDRVSTTKVRSAHFGNGWIQGKDGDWKALTKARFTADRNPVTNINAAREGERFVLATGGDTTNQNVKLRELMELPQREERTPPKGLPTVGSKQ